MGITSDKADKAKPASQTQVVRKQILVENPPLSTLHANEIMHQVWRVNGLKLVTRTVVTSFVECCNCT